MNSDLSITGQGAPLRVGVMIDGASVPRWVARVLDQIDACAFADVVGCVRMGKPRRRSGAIETGWGARSRLLYETYCRLDARHFGAADDPLDDIDVSDRLAKVPAIAIAPLGDEALDTVRGWELDVMLALGPRSARRAIGDCARYGTWCYQFGDPQRCGGEPPLFWEIYDAAPVSASALHRVADRSSPPEVIYSSFSATDPISLHRNRVRVYSKSAEFVVRKLRDVHRDGELGVLRHDDHAGREPAKRGTPTNRQMLRFGWRVAVRLGHQKTRAARARQQWFLAYQQRRSGLPTSETLRGATLLVPPRERFYADPCLVDWRGSSYLFFEDFDFAERKGVVSCCRVTPDGRHASPEIVLERPYHLSYPFVFFTGEEAFMLPETAANGAIELYKAHSFPTGWRLDSVLMTDVRAVDPTLVEHDGRYWLFANVAVDGASHDDELCLFSSEAIRGPWEPHPRNPVISDVRRARPAGRPFVDDSGALIRPSQDCSGFYGSAVILSRIEELSATEYRETPVGRLEPGWHPSNLGTHTYTRSELWEAFDGRVWRRRRV